MKRFGVANCVTSLRIIGAIGLMFAVPASGVFYLLYWICGVSDALDGWIARRTGSAGEFGARLDSVADLMFYGVLAAKLLPALHARLPEMMWWMIGGIVLVRLCAYGVAAVKYRRFAALHTWMNKLTGAAVFAVPCILPLKAFVPLCAVFCGIAALAALEELLIHICSEEYQADRKSLFWKMARRRDASIQ